jgi:hypothetical protein
VIDRSGRTVHGAQDEQFKMAGGQFAWRSTNIPWCMADRLAATG